MTIYHLMQYCMCPNDLKSSHIEESMRNYCQNTSICRRELLLKDFDSSNVNDTCVSVCENCCDICQIKDSLLLT